MSMGGREKASKKKVRVGFGSEQLDQKGREREKQSLSKGTE